MRLLLDTQLLLWAADFVAEPTTRLSPAALSLIRDPDNQLLFSAVSIWEIAIKFGLGRASFRVDPHVFRRGLLDSGYEESSVTGAHAAGVAALPPIHKDPFDRLLIAQAIFEGVTLLTADEKVARY